ncbi:hypothetical protein SteCoe_3767 [Stentor coeruleus]|uniref:Phosphoribosyltransferase domain-containing protein n=1 Tax=Stentor coeruleus TaxID=5963 RepID=A0A1R2CWG4_9CILI|nr:hypothetical protein SteCoe_3767 [Stentor coeruleus]
MENKGNYIFIADEDTLSPNMVQISRKYKPFLKNILITNRTIKDRIKNISQNILNDCPNQEIIFICVLRGAFRFCRDLLKRVEKDSYQSQCVHRLEFIRARSYVNDVQEEVVIEGLDILDLKNKSVVIIEDMVDKGKTLMKVREAIWKKEPSSLKICVLAYKRNVENVYVVPDYIGFSLPDEWIVGYNIDYNGFFRDMPHVAVLNDEGKVHFRSN